MAKKVEQFEKVINQMNKGEANWMISYLLENKVVIGKVLSPYVNAVLRNVMMQSSL